MQDRAPAIIDLWTGDGGFAMDPPQHPVHQAVTVPTIAPAFPGG